MICLQQFVPQQKNFRGLSVSEVCFAHQLNKFVDCVALFSVIHCIINKLSSIVQLHNLIVCDVRKEINSE